MKANEDYLDELLNSMNQDISEDSLLNSFGLEDENKVSVADIGMDTIDQAMIDALLAGAMEEEKKD